MENQKILIIEDSEDAYNIVHTSLRSQYHVDWAQNVQSAKSYLSKFNYKIILLDIILPDGDGFQLCSLLQSQESTQEIPIILLTSKSSTSDKVLGFSVGANDYLVKPFDPLELRARIESKLRIYHRQKLSSNIQKISGLEINRENQRIFVITSNGKKEIDLTPIEFKLLAFLAKEPNKVFSRDDILNSVWGEGVHVFSRSVDTHISKLRKKLFQHAHCVQSVHGSGYKFAVKDHHILKQNSVFDL